MRPLCCAKEQWIWNFISCKYTNMQIGTTKNKMRKRLINLYLKDLLLIGYLLPESCASFFYCVWSLLYEKEWTIPLWVPNSANCELNKTNNVEYVKQIDLDFQIAFMSYIYFTRISAMPVQCCTSWAIRPNGSWAVREFVITGRWT